MDMLVKLYDLPKSCAVFERLGEQGIHIRRALAAEKHKIAAWVRENFAEGWASETEIAFSRQMRSPYRRKRCQSPRSKPEASGQRCFQPVPTYRSSRRTNNGGPTRATLACRYCKGYRPKGGTIMKKIAAIFAIAFAFTTGMAAVTVVAALA
jgi:hypothetical protein